MNPNPYEKTIHACFFGYIVQAIVNNFVPLLFLTFQSSFGISLSRITWLVTINFGIQLLVDLISAAVIDRMGYRLSIVLGHVLSTLGLVLLSVLPDRMPDPYVGLLIAVCMYAVGGGLLEVLVSPIVESCPSEHKEQTMSLLHSFYCWGHVGVVLLSTAFFMLFGIQYWRILALIWALIPAVNTIAFLRVPIAPLTEEEAGGVTVGNLMKEKIFWVLMLLMACAGACEQAVSQWASTFAEKGLGVSKTMGDLAGPMMFAILMGSSRAFYGKYGGRINLERFMVYSGILCVCSYLLISLSPSPVFSLIGCGICGLSVGIMWPGTFSIAAAAIKGGTAMFAFLALAGDLGCSGGPTFVGMMSDVFHDDLKKGILVAVIFPILLLLGMAVYKSDRKRLIAKVNSSAEVNAACAQVSSIGEKKGRI